jgi:hypothetical protein
VIRIAKLFGIAIPLVAACSGPGSDGVHCAVTIAGAQQCYGYTGLTGQQTSAERDTCTAQGGSLVDSCPSGYVGCCSTTTAGFTTEQCYYAGTAATLKTSCPGTWSTIEGPGNDGTSDGGVISSGPVIVSLTASPSIVGSNGTTISAIVNEPPGGGTVSGGTLSDTLTNTPYGAFTTPGGQGTFVFALTWNALNMAQEIGVGLGQTAARMVTATFFDNEGRMTSQTLTLTLACEAGKAACNGNCISVQSDDQHCGSCTNDCSKFSADAVCSAGHCTQIEETSTTLMSCAAVCSAVGLQCDCPMANPQAFIQCRGYPLAGGITYITDCSQSSSNGSPFYTTQCYCKQ